MLLSSIGKRRVKISACKSTEGQIIIPMPIPKEVHIPMTHGQDATAVPIVSVGDKVLVGQLIAKGATAFSAPVHSSVSGTVRDLMMEPAQSGGFDLHIVIETDGRQDLSPEVIPPVVTTQEEFLAAAAASGIIGLGGAGYPLAAKLAPYAEFPTDILIVNGVECEPYLTADLMTTLAHGNDIVKGACAMMKWLDIRMCFIAVDGDSSSYEKVREAIKPFLPEDGSISLYPSRGGYPFGAESLLVREITGRVISGGNIPAEAGCLVCNVNTVVKLWHYLSTGLPLVNKSITVDGNAVAGGRNLQVPIGTRIGDILDFCGRNQNNIAMVLLDGIMMGHPAPSIGTAVSKANNAILFFNEAFATMAEETSCINCGRCIDVCPMGLMPCKIANAVENSDAKEVALYGPADCIACGMCSYICPARRRLTTLCTKAKKALDIAEVITETRKEASEDEA